ncbi:unnamed protein product [Parascedosporium putredinis]|uniref:Origin recognition complex subunit 2 n=1 Tax=Parascedosporium putredinis TaxID=1442378 RepID=A0A9P1GU23_9PEZI|nr:unnamed protein product [Parascedosporium putredinis]CAI7987375.1 unnamed protein product [Parascedosporium putredinis]
MPRRKPTTKVVEEEEEEEEEEEDIDGENGGSRPKRKRNPSLKLREIVEDGDVIVAAAPKRRKSATTDDEEMTIDPSPVESDPEPQPAATPKRKGRPPKSASASAAGTPTGKNAETPSRRGRPSNTAAITPSRLLDGHGITPRRRSAADRSARKKSMRALIRNVVDDESSGDEEQERLARRIYESSDDDDDDDADGEGRRSARDTDADATDAASATEPDTPSKRTPGRRPGRPRKVRSPSPPRHLPPHEMYFFHNKPGKAKTSDNTLGSSGLLTHDEYFGFWRDYENPHAENLAFLESIHLASFPQWEFEMSEGFTVCLYGMGSKRSLLRKLAAHMHAARVPGEDLKIVVANGYVRTVTPRDILSAAWSALLPDTPPPPNPSPSCKASPPTSPTTPPPPSSSSSTPSTRPRSASPPPRPSSPSSPPCPASASPAPPTPPISPPLEVVDDVHELLGRAARRAGGREAVTFVLKSLTQNARSLYALLVAEVITALDEGGGAGGEDNPGLEYKTLYNKAVEAFVCPSSEMAFRQLLREFHDHQMITSTKDALGTELISVPFRRDELEAILEDIES